MPPPAHSTCLELQSFGFAFGDRTVVRSIDLVVPDHGLFALLGPVAAGKSSLLRLLSGEIANRGSCHCWGTATYLGAPLGDSGHPALAGQRARFVVGSVLEQLADSLRSRHRLTQAEQRDAARTLLCGLDLEDLAERLDTPVMELPPPRGAASPSRAPSRRRRRWCSRTSRPRRWTCPGARSCWRSSGEWPATEPSCS